jgi:hypothetical protein
MRQDWKSNSALDWLLASVADVTCGTPAACRRLLTASISVECIAPWLAVLMVGTSARQSLTYWLWLAGDFRFTASLLVVQQRRARRLGHALGHDSRL